MYNLKERLKKLDYPASRERCGLLSAINLVLAALAVGQKSLHRIAAAGVAKKSNSASDQ
jgi:hypothetical protein